MWELRERVKSLLEKTGTTQAELCREISHRFGYRVYPAEMSNALSGSLESPKANRILADAYSLLERKQEKQVK